MPRYRLTRSTLVAAVLVLGVAGCGSGSDDSTSAGSAGSAISAKRCAENKAAGKITYLSGYQFQSSVSILEYIAAAKLGYFKDLCLTVDLKPGSGDTAQNTKLLAGGQATVSAISEQDLIQAQANGIDIKGISSYSNAGLDILMTNKDITDLTQLDGKVVGHKGYVPATVEAMLVKAGVKWDSLKLVKEGYDPRCCRASRVASKRSPGSSRTSPTSSRRPSKDVTVWKPVDYKIPSSIGAMAVNPAFAKAHPHAVEDILRAALHAYAYCSASEAHISECVGYAAKLSGPTYDKKLNATIWKTETQVVKENPTPGQPLGGIDSANVTQLVAMLHQFRIVPSSVTAAKATGWFDTSFVKDIYSGDKLVWPAP